MNHPQKPSKKGYIKWSLIIGLPLLFIGGSELFTSDWSRQYSIAHGNGDPYFQGGFLIFLAIIILLIIWGTYIHQFDRYKLSVENPEEYAELIRQERLKQQAEQTRQAEAYKRQLEMTPACPICGSKNIKRISTSDRALSIAFTGLASGKIGKQYQCKQCKHMW